MPAEVVLRSALNTTGYSNAIDSDDRSDSSVMSFVGYIRIAGADWSDLKLTLQFIRIADFYPHQVTSIPRYSLSVAGLVSYPGIPKVRTGDK
jgi:hypothetical protein